MSFFSFSKKTKSEYPFSTDINNLYNAFINCRKKNIGFEIDSKEFNSSIKESLFSLIVPNSIGLKDSYSGLDYYYISLAEKDNSIYFVNSYSNIEFPEHNKTTILRITYQNLYEIAKSISDDCYQSISRINEENWFVILNH